MKAKFHWECIDKDVARDIAKRVLGLLGEDGSGWTKHVEARDAEGSKTSYKFRQAKSFNLVTAGRHATEISGIASHDEYLHFLMAVSNLIPKEDFNLEWEIGQWNDDPATEWQDVKSVLERIITDES